MKLIRVAANSRTSSVAGAIAGMIRDDRRAAVQVVGAAAVNQVVKAVILANEYLQKEGIQIACVPEYIDISENGIPKSAIRFVIGICLIQDDPADV